MLERTVSNEDVVRWQHVELANFIGSPKRSAEYVFYSVAGIPYWKHYVPADLLYRRTRLCQCEAKDFNRLMQDQLDDRSRFRTAS